MNTSVSKYALTMSESSRVVSVAFQIAHQNINIVIPKRALNHIHNTKSTFAKHAKHKCGAKYIVTKKPQE